LRHLPRPARACRVPAAALPRPATQTTGAHSAPTPHHPHSLPSGRRGGTIRAEVRLNLFTVELSDKPGSLAKMAAALGERGIKHQRHLGIAKTRDGALMLATSDRRGHAESAFKP